MWWKTKGDRKDPCFRQIAKMSCTGRKYRKGNKNYENTCTGQLRPGGFGGCC